MLSYAGRAEANKSQCQWDRIDSTNQNRRDRNDRAIRDNAKLLQKTYEYSSYRRLYERNSAGQLEAFTSPIGELPSGLSIEANIQTIGLMERILSRMTLLALQFGVSFWPHCIIGLSKPAVASSLLNSTLPHQVPFVGFAVQTLHMKWEFKTGENYPQQSRLLV